MRWSGRTRLAQVVVPLSLGVWAIFAAAGAGLLLPGLAVTVPLVVVLVFAPRWPLAGLVATFGALLVPDSWGVSLPEDPFLAMVVYASYVFGRHASMAAQPWAGAGVFLLLSLNLLAPDRDPSAADAVFPVLLTAGPWLLGISVQLATRREDAAVRYADDLDARHGEAVRRAAVEERLGIAQELHDVGAHDISAVSLQAQVARRTVEAGQPVAGEDLRTIEQNAQQAMIDLRRLLGVLRPSNVAAPIAPSEGLDQLDALVEACGKLGHTVDLQVSGVSRPLPPALSLAAFRIVQETLTNARRHGLPGRTEVEVIWSDESVHLRVRNPAAGDSTSRGHGLTGIEERAQMFGGQATFTADGARGRWVVEVDLPAPRPARVGS
jgi:signal transduction histidine kinase